MTDERAYRQLNYIPTLDGWRAIAVCLVMATHSVPMIRNGGYYLIASFFNHAGYGVDIFFGLSGFLISTLLLDERERSGTISLRGFYTRRVFRIVPPLLVYLLVVYSAGLVLGGTEVLTSLLFLRNYVDGSWYTGHFWSLSIEEHFYLVMPLLILCLRPRALMVTCLALIGLCIVVRWYEFTFMHLGANPQFRTEARVDALLWGSVLAQAVRIEGIKAQFKYLLSPTVFGALVIATVMLLSLYDSQAFRRTLTAGVIPIILVFTVLNPEHGLGRLLETKAMRFIGRLSYSLYVWQMLFLVPASRPLGMFQSFPFAIVMPFVMAILSYRYVEKPFIRMGYKLAARTQRPTERLARG